MRIGVQITGRQTTRLEFGDVVVLILSVEENDYLRVVQSTMVQKTKLSFTNNQTPNHSHNSTQTHTVNMNDHCTIDLGE